MKRFALLFAICLIAVLFVTNNGQSKLKSYYSGDAVSFNNNLYISSTNSDSLEVFKLEGTELKRLVKVRPFDARFNKNGNFYDSKLSVENGRLIIYAIGDYTLYKYELTGDNQLSLISSNKNTYWEWYNRVDKFGDNIVTISQKSVKVWNADLQVIVSYDIANYDTPYNIRAYNDQYILNVQDGYLNVFDRNTNTKVANIALNYKNKVGNRQAYQDENGDLFVIDDYYAKKFSLDGRLLGSFKHLDYDGYDMAASGDNNYIYFSNGAGVVKLDKQTMRDTDYRWSTSLGGARGWAMGLKVVSNNGDKVVIFNNSNILVLNDTLNKVASFEATEEAEETSTENLFLRLDHTTGAPNATIILNGGGYFPNEDLTIDFTGTKTKTKTDSRGRFNQSLVVPEKAAKAVDIKVDGESSKLTYSISFKIQ